MLAHFQARPVTERFGDFVMGLPRRVSNAALDVVRKAQGRGMSAQALSMAMFFTLLAVLVYLRFEVRLGDACFTRSACFSTESKEGPR